MRRPAGHIGERFDAVVIDKNRRGVTVQLSGVAIVAALEAHIPLEERIPIVVKGVDPVARHVQMAPVAATD